MGLLVGCCLVLVGFGWFWFVLACFGWSDFGWLLVGSWLVVRWLVVD